MEPEITEREQHEAVQGRKEEKKRKRREHQAARRKMQIAARKARKEEQRQLKEASAKRLKEEKERQAPESPRIKVLDWKNRFLPSALLPLIAANRKALRNVGISAGILAIFAVVIAVASRSQAEEKQVEQAGIEETKKADEAAREKARAKAQRTAALARRQEEVWKKTEEVPKLEEQKQLQPLEQEEGAGQAATTAQKDTEGMVLIPGGEFMMGSPPDAGDENERPQHMVFLDAFYMDKYEVTVGQYKEFVKATGHRSLPYYVTRYSPSNKHPVVGVSWGDANAYAQWAGKRLPTEAEWEYACRAGTTTEYSTGESINHNNANHSGTGGKDRWDKSAAPVGSFAANAWGLYDMHGNVWEWCSDWNDETYYSRSPSENPRNMMRSENRVARGGSWSLGPRRMRSANRYYFLPDSENASLGFRCVKDK